MTTLLLAPYPVITTTQMKNSHSSFVLIARHRFQIILRFYPCPTKSSRGWLHCCTGFQRNRSYSKNIHGPSLFVALMDKLQPVDWPCWPCHQQLPQACTNHASLCLCCGYVGSKIFEKISCLTGSRLNQKCHQPHMSDLPGARATRPVLGWQGQSWLPSTTGAPSLQKGRPQQETPKSGSYVSHLHPRKDTNFKDWLRHPPTDQPRHALCLLVIQIPEGSTGIRWTDTSPMLAQYKILSGWEEPPTQPSQFRICWLHLNHLWTTKTGASGDSILCPVQLAAGIVRALGPTQAPRNTPSSPPTCPMGKPSK